MMNGESMAEKLRAMMQKQQGGRSSFTMTGQYAGSVMREDGPMGSREFVMYDSPNGEQIKVYGNWNEYAVSRDEEGRDMIADEDYPIIQNEAGEFILDEVRHNENMDTAYERQPVERMARETEMESTQGASKIENLLEKLRDARGPRMMPGRFAEGGAMRGSSNPVVDMKKKIIEAMEDGSSNKDIMIMIQKSPLSKFYEFNWNKDKMMVEAHPLKEDDRGSRPRFQEGGAMPGDKVGKMKKAIIRMLEGGASDREINDAIEKSGLGSSYDFNWDNVQMTVSVKPKDDDRFGPKDKGGQRGDMFAYGGMLKRMKEMREGGKITAKGPKTAGPFQGPFGGPGASKTEDLLERLNDYKRRR